MHKNPVTWWEFASKAAEKSVQFLKKAFDWEMVFDPALKYYQNLGRLCIFRDPTGQHYGMIKRLWE